MQDRYDINLIGGPFHHSLSSSGAEPKFIRWVKNVQTSPISIYVDESFQQVPNPVTKNYAWLCESKTIIGHIYKWAEQNAAFLSANYEGVFTHDVTLLEVSPIFKLCRPGGTPFIHDGEIYKKSKLVSMIASNKVLCPDHVFRQRMIQKYKNECDHFGTGFNQIVNKVDGLREYCFSITMENGTYPNMFSEKIADCFITGTIPIYYGINNIGDFFNTDGIITLTEDFKISDLSFELYESKMEAIKENYKITKNTLTAEDYIFDNYIRYAI